MPSELTYQIVPLTDERMDSIAQEVIRLKGLINQGGASEFTPTSLLILALVIWKKAGVTRAQAHAIVDPILENLEEGN